MSECLAKWSFGMVAWRAAGERSGFALGRRWLMVALLVAAAAFYPSRAAAQTDGIYADFVTSLGSFTCRLDYTNAPRSVANFMALATGQRPWLDLTTGRAVTNAFYNGLTFHRVIAGFMNQAGSPNGQGTDDPGYALRTECTPKLVFDSFGVLAMANSGPNSDGAQFFITVAPFTTGNNVYSIFGRLTAGSNVVYAINHVATSSSDKPLTNVVIQQVAIRRVGTAAQAFDFHAQGLPLVTNLPLTIARSSTGCSLTFSNRLYADNSLYSATNLAGSWTGDSVGIEITPPTTNRLAVSTNAPRQFFRLAQVQYPSSTFAPKNVYGKSLVLTFTNGVSGTISLAFDAAGGGTDNFSGNTGTITSYSWTQGVYRAWLWPIYFSNLVPMTFQLSYSSTTNGTFSGTAYATSQIALAGTFTATGP